MSYDKRVYHYILIDVKNATPTFKIYIFLTEISGGRTGLVVRASDSGSGDPGSILGRVGVLFP